MLLSLCAQCPKDWPLQKALPVIREAGYKFVELSWPHIERSFEHLENPAAELRELLDGHGLTLICLGIRDLTLTHQKDLGDLIVTFDRQMQSTLKMGLSDVSLGG